jgi:hypothetical protein
MKFRIRYAKFGAHIHCRFFQAPAFTWQKCGELVFDGDSWPHALEMFRRGDVQILAEGELDPEAV